MQRATQLEKLSYVFERIMSNEWASHKAIAEQKLSTAEIRQTMRSKGMPKTTNGRDPIKEADIRPIAKTLDWNKQRQMWKHLVGSVREHTGVVAPSNGK